MGGRREGQPMSIHWPASDAHRSGALAESQGKHSRDPRTGDCHVVRFICGVRYKVREVPLRSQCPISVQWKTSNLVFIGPRNRAHVQRLCAMPKPSPYESLVESPAVLWPLALLYPVPRSAWSLLEVHMATSRPAARATRLSRRENAQTDRVSTYYLPGKRKRERLCQADHSIPGLGWTDQLTNQLPKLSRASDGSTP